MVSLLKAECGYQFTSKLEGMFNDMRISKETAEKSNNPFVVPSVGGRHRRVLRRMRDVRARRWQTTSVAADCWALGGGGKRAFSALAFGSLDDGPPVVVVRIRIRDEREKCRKINHPSAAPSLVTSVVPRGRSS